MVYWFDNTDRPYILKIRFEHCKCIGILQNQVKGGLCLFIIIWGKFYIIRKENLRSLVIMYR